MRVTIICDDYLAAVDGRAYHLSPELFPADVHAVQWYASKGEVERRCDAAGRQPANEAITNMTEFQPIIDAWKAAHESAIAPGPAPVAPAAPEPTAEEASKAQRKEQLLYALSSLDLKRIRPTAEGDSAYLASFNGQAIALRAELAALS